MRFYGLVTLKRKNSEDTEFYIYERYQNAVDLLTQAAIHGDWKVIYQIGIHTAWETKEGHTISVMGRTEGGFKLP